MNLVWPITALFGGLAWLAFYWRWGRGARRDDGAANDEGGADAPEVPMAVAVFKGSSHCGAGCALGDLVAESADFLAPGVAVALGWKTLFAEKTFAVWILDYLTAFLFGIAFQYFSLRPSGFSSRASRLFAAVKADAASITAWQVGMYGGMALFQFAWFARAFGRPARVNTPEFWWAMQGAMLCGFATAYPMNWILVKAGVKERM